MPATTSETGFAGAGRAAWRAMLLRLAWPLLVAWPVVAAAAHAPAAGEPAPPLQARLFDGRTLDLAAMRGQVVVLNLWASWCAPCRQEMPVLARLAHEYAARGVLVLGLSADDRHDLRDAQEVARGYDYPLGLLAEAPRNGFGQPAALPLTYVIDANGRIDSVLRAANGSVEQVLRAAIDSALAAGPSPGGAP